MTESGPGMPDKASRAQQRVQATLIPSAQLKRWNCVTILLLWPMSKLVGYHSMRATPPKNGLLPRNAALAHVEPTKQARGRKHLDCRIIWAVNVPLVASRIADKGERYIVELKEGSRDLSKSSVKVSDVEQSSGTEI